VSVRDNGDHDTGDSSCTQLKVSAANLCSVSSCTVAYVLMVFFKLMFVVCCASYDPTASTVQCACVCVCVWFSVRQRGEFNEVSTRRPHNRTTTPKAAA